MTHAHGAALAAALLCASIGLAMAHVTLQTDKALPNSTYRAVLQVGQGYGGSWVTTV